MDPAARPHSITGSASQALITTVHQVSMDVSHFVRRCGAARTDLEPVMRELSELQMVSQLLDDFEAQSDATPDELQSHLGPIINNSIGVVWKVQDVLRRHEAAGWTVDARDEIGELTKLLCVYRSVVRAVSDLISIVVTRGIRHSDEERTRITAVRGELQRLGSSLVISYSNATLAREHFALQVHLGQIVTYSETLAGTDLWQDAVKTLDEAERKANLDRQQQHAVRESNPLLAPLTRGHSADAQVVAAGVRNNGLENLLQLANSERYDPNRPPSMFFNPSPAPADSKPPAMIESSGPSGTGFIVMDGFINSAHGAVTVPSIPYYGEQPQFRPQNLGASEGEPESSRRSFEYQDSAERSITRPNAARPQPVPAAMRASAAGLEVYIPNEKELATHASISDEALAFAQVPIHVLDRLSVNLVEHMYPTNISSDDQSTSANRTYQDDDLSDAASHTAIASVAGLRDDNLQFSQLDLARTRAASASASHPRSQPAPVSQTQQRYQPSSQDSIHLPSQLTPMPADTRTTFQGQDDYTAMTTSRLSLTSAHSTPNLPSQQQHSFVQFAGRSGLRAVDSMSTMKTANTQAYMAQMAQMAHLAHKPLPRPPLVYIPRYPGPFIKKKVVVVGNFSCGKTCLITRMARGQYPRSKADEMRITETLKLSVDEAPIELCLWDIRGIDYDPSWLHKAHVALVCFSVNIGSTDSKGKHLGRWVAEVNRNCPSAAIVLVGLKSDMRFHAKSAERLARTGRALVTPEQGEQFRENIGAMRYVECSARTGDGVQAVLAETARVAMQVQRGGRAAARKGSMRASRPLSRIGKFFGFGGHDG